MPARHPALEEAIAKTGARLLWQREAWPKRGRVQAPPLVSAWSVGGSLRVTLEYPGGGFEVLATAESIHVADAIRYFKEGSL